MQNGFRKLCVALMILSACFQVHADEEPGILPGGCTNPAEAKVISHSELKTYKFNGNAIQAVATAAYGQ